MKIVFFTGAGISAESGISTFRDNNGLWENHNVELICNIKRWKKNKELVFKFYNQRRNQLKTVKPNKIHEMIAKVQKEYDNVTIITQNVDDLLEKAGCENVMHVHGELTKMQCLSCNYIWDIGYEEQHIDTKCPKCNSSEEVKPTIVFFYEEAPLYKKMKEEFDSLTENDIFIVMGTMGNVIHISYELNRTRATAILNNLEKSKYIEDYNIDHVFYEPGTKVVEKILDIIETKRIENCY